MSKYIKNKETSTSSFAYLFKAYLISTILFFIVLASISAIFTLILYNTKNPITKTDLAGAVSLYITSLICGLLMSKKIKNKRLINGLAFGFVIVLILFTVSLFTNDMSYFKLLTPVFTFLGSLLGAKETTKRKRKFH